MMRSNETRRTVLWHKCLNVAVMTYKEPFGEVWRTVLTAFANDNPCIWNLADTEAEANERHDEAVRMVKLMGFEET